LNEHNNHSWSAVGNTHLGFSLCVCAAQPTYLVVDQKEKVKLEAKRFMVFSA